MTHRIKQRIKIKFEGIVPDDDVIERTLAERYGSVDVIDWDSSDPTLKVKTANGKKEFTEIIKVRVVFRVR